jgi:hypothetical protein
MRSKAIASLMPSGGRIFVFVDFSDRTSFSAFRDAGAEDDPSGRLAAVLYRGTPVSLPSKIVGFGTPAG